MLTHTSSSFCIRSNIITTDTELMRLCHFTYQCMGALFFSPDHEDDGPANEEHRQVAVVVVPRLTRVVAVQASSHSRRRCCSLPYRAHGRTGDSPPPPRTGERDAAA